MRQNINLKILTPFLKYFYNFNIYPKNNKVLINIYIYKWIQQYL